MFSDSYDTSDQIDSFRRERRKRPAILTGILLGVVAALVIGWFTFGKYILVYRESASGELPVIKADKEPFRAAPKTPGGLEVPDQDKLVYERLRQQNKTGLTVERLLPGPEMPKAPEEAAEEPHQDGIDQVAMLVAEFSDEETEIASGVILDENGRPVEVMFKTTAVTKETVAESLKKEPEAAQTRPAVQETGFSAQLFSIRTKEKAEKESDRLIKKYQDIVGTLPHKIQEVLVDKTLFYRLRIGDFKTKEEAKALCDIFKAKKQECIIAK